MLNFAKVIGHFVIALVFILFTETNAQSKLPIGINVDENNYWTASLIFNDVIKTASKWISFNAEGSSPWDTQLAEKIDYDSTGWPLYIPFALEGEAPQKLRFLFNNNYKGAYVLLFDGQGRITINGGAVHEKINENKYDVELSGKGGHVWIDVHESRQENYIKNMRLIPKQWERDESGMPVFHEKYVEGLRPFHALRFMPWMKINGSLQKEWQDRSTPWFFSQGWDNGVALEYAIQLCNLLSADAWFCAPHQADDDYMTRFAEMARDHLDPALKVYVEYSNEVWNWGFAQSHYILDNAPEHNNQYVVDDLTAINPVRVDHPEKDAYMMQRTFRLWQDVFTGEHRDRLIRVAAGQHAWVDNSRRILKYLFKTDKNGAPVSGGAYNTSSGAGCDAFAVGGYFNYAKEHHDAWNSMNPAVVTPEMVVDAAAEIYDATTGSWTDDTADYVNAWDVDYLVYEGGQHMQPWQQGEWGYNQAVWDAQINPKMYDLYIRNFQKHVEPHVNCQLFMAFAYIGVRESRYGSWGHLESNDQIDAGDYMEIAPKYQALLDANGEFSTNVHSQSIKPEEFKLTNYPNPFNEQTRIIFSLPRSGQVKLDVYNLAGRLVARLLDEPLPSGAHQLIFNGKDLPSGLYFYRLSTIDLQISEMCLLLK